MSPSAPLIALLTSLDFPENDARVYLALLKHSPCAAGVLIQETGLHRNVVYTSLAHLIARKLAAEKIVRGTKQFTGVDPALLVEEFRNKEERAEALVDDLRSLASSALETITVHHGNDEYLALITGLIRQLPKGGTKYVLGTGGEAFMRETMRPIWRRYHKAALEQGIKIRMISYESQREAIAEDVKQPPIYQVRYLPDEIENPAGLHIYPEANTVLNIIYSDEATPVTAIKITNTKLVQGYLHLFKNLWNLAKP